VPNPNGRTTGGPPTPPLTPIDENLPTLLIIAVLFGMYIVYNENFKTKNQH
jgi:hypothetical protein